MLISGTAKHEVFVRELNARIETLNNSLATRKGRSKKNGEQSKTEIKTENVVVCEKNARIKIRELAKRFLQKKLVVKN